MVRLTSTGFARLVMITIVAMPTIAEDICRQDFSSEKAYQEAVREKNLRCRNVSSGPYLEYCAKSYCGSAASNAGEHVEVTLTCKAYSDGTEKVGLDPGAVWRTDEIEFSYHEEERLGVLSNLKLTHRISENYLRLNDAKQIKQSTVFTLLDSGAWLTDELFWFSHEAPFQVPVGEINKSLRMKIEGGITLDEIKEIDTELGDISADLPIRYEVARKHVREALFDNVLTSEEAETLLIQFESIFANSAIELNQLDHQSYSINRTSAIFNAGQGWSSECFIANDSASDAICDSLGFKPATDAFKNCKLQVFLEARRSRDGVQLF